MNFFSKHIQFLYLFTLLAGTLFCIPEIFVNRFFTAPALWMQVGIVIGVLSFVLVKRKHILLPSCEFLAILLLWLIYFLWRQGLNVETAVSIVTNSLSLLLFYQILIKNSNKEKLFLAGSIIAVILCIWCVGQLLGWLPRYHNLFSATGPFDNPAGISASLALLLPFTLYQVENNKRWMRFICAIIVIAIVGCIIVLQARAAIIAAGVSTFVYGIRWLKTYTELKLSVIHYSLVALVAVLLFSGLYLLKKDSANGRLLIWRCSAELIAQKPLVGHGKNGFIANYMNEQADYFTRHPDSKYTILADNIRHPFNEYIKSIVEYGIIGFFLIVLLLFYPFYYSRKTSSKTAPAIRLSLLSIAICALFSYPLNYPSVRLMTVVLLASLLASGGERRMKLINGYFTKIIVLLLSSGLLCTTVYQTYNEREWHTVAHQSLRGKTRQMLPRYKRLYARMHRNELFLYNYAAELNVAEHYHESLQVAQECSGIWADYDLQMLMADNCLQLQQFKDAESYLEKASAMCPVKFMPLYRLTELYLETERKEEAIVLAQQIVEKDVKIQSPVINSIKNNMRNLLNNADNSID